jgi:uncharacterized membrane protein YidH (DUF202 family)
MSQAKSVTSGFIAVASAICLFVTLLWLPIYVNWGVGLALFAFLAVPFLINSYFAVKRFRQKKQDDPAGVKKAKNLLMAMQGFGFACWFFDVLSTIFVINILRSGQELNILGWPYSALGALAFYIPITFVAYFLLFKVKSKESFYATVAITALTVFMGLRNLWGSLYNFPKTEDFTPSFENLTVLGIWVAITITLVVLNVKLVIKKRKCVKSGYMTL